MESRVRLVAGDLSALGVIAFGTLLFRFGLSWPTGPANVDAVQLSRGTWIVATAVLVMLAISAGALVGLFKPLGIGQTALRAFSAIMLGCALFAALGAGLFWLGIQWPTSVVNMGVLVAAGTPAVLAVHWGLRNR